MNDEEVTSLAISFSGRIRELEQIQTVLARETGANAILVGLPGQEKMEVIWNLCRKIKDKTSSVQLNFKTPIEKDKNWQTSDLYMERIREEKETIFTALKQLSKTLTGNVFMLPSIKNADETSYKTL